MKSVFSAAVLVAATAYGDQSCVDEPVYFTFLLDATGSMASLWVKMKEQMTEAVQTIIKSKPDSKFALYRVGDESYGCDQMGINQSGTEFLKTMNNKMTGTAVTIPDWPKTEQEALDLGWPYADISQRSSANSEETSRCTLISDAQIGETPGYKRAVVIVTDDTPLFFDQHPKENLKMIPGPPYKRENVPLTRWHQDYQYPTHALWRDCLRRSNLYPFFAISAAQVVNVYNMTNKWWKDELQDMGFDVSKHYMWFHPEATGLGTWLIQASEQTTCGDSPYEEPTEASGGRPIHSSESVGERPIHSSEKPPVEDEIDCCSLCNSFG